MKRVSPYVKMRVLGAIEHAPGNTNIAGIKHVSGLVFRSEEDEPLQFTWRTIQTWYSRYKKDGITQMMPKTRSDKGHPRKVRPEELQEAIEAALPHFHGKPKNIAAVYRVCIEQGLLQRERVAPNTFRRLVDRKILVSDPHRTKADMMARPETGGGIRHAAEGDVAREPGAIVGDKFPLDLDTFDENAQHNVTQPSKLRHAPSATVRGDQEVWQ